MKPTTQFDPELEQIVDRYESDRQESSSIDVADYFLSSDHPHHRTLAIELLRVDLEYAWSDGQRSLVKAYRERFASLLQDPQLLEPIAFEEYRLRRDAGEMVDASEYARDFGLSVAHWPILSSASDEGSGQADHRAETSWADSASGRGSHEVGDDPSKVHPVRHPRAGERMAGFDFVAEIGHGAFSRVYLAQQNSLANRFVVLKLSSQHWAEADLLARLQHANIVPIYSVHRREGMQIVCMPFLGFCTLAEVLRHIYGASARPGIGDSSQPPASGAVLLSTVANHRAETLVGSFGEKNELREQIERQQLVSAGHANHLSQQLQRCSYVEACLWMMADVADGLAHAHEAGILHRDLKPANILITDDGRPMLLDFNLSEDLTDLTNVDTAIGGTLAYMAPEHLRALVRCGLADQRSDLYALGIILFEMLTGSRPFPDRKGIVEQVVPDMIDDRQRLLATLPNQLAHATPAVTSIVMRLLAFDGEDRYQSADELREDLRRHLHDRPLRFAPNRSWRERMMKWSRRHPRLSSFSTFAFAGAVLLTLLTAAWFMREEHLANLSARSKYEQFQRIYQEARLALSAADVDRSLLPSTIKEAERVLATYAANDAHALRKLEDYRRLDANSQATMEDQLLELQFRLSVLHQRRARGLSGELRQAALQQAADWNQRAAQWRGAPQSIIERQRMAVASDQQHAVPPITRVVASLSSDQAIAKSGSQLFKRRQVNAHSHAAGETGRFHDYYLGALASLEEGDYLQSRRLVERAIEKQPQDFSAWFARAKTSAALHELEAAVTEFTVCSALNSDSWLPWFHRGLAYYELQRFEEAESDFSRALQRRPDLSSLWINRALSRKALRRWQEALDDLQQASAKGAQETRLHFVRAELLQALGREKESQAEQALGLKATPNDELSWIARGMAQLPSNPQAAIDDLYQALRLEPLSYLALRNASHVLSDYLHRNDEAIALLDRILTVRPDDAEMVAARGVLHARAGHVELAKQDAVLALQKDQQPRTRIHVACIYALLSNGDAELVQQAVQLVQRGIAEEPKWVAQVAQDSDLLGLRSNAVFQQVIASGMKLLREP